MGRILQFLGACWAIIGFANLIGMPWETASNGLLTFGLVFNVLLFIFPGMGLYGLGSLMVRKVAKG